MPGAFLFCNNAAGTWTRMAVDRAFYGIVLPTMRKAMESHQDGKRLKSMINVGVIGYGYWGPNIVRNFHAAEGMQVKAICDLSPAMLERAVRNFPFLTPYSDCHEMIRATDIDVVAIITPVFTHYELAKEALLNGKHVFVEKPFTSNTAQAQELIDLAEARGLTIMVDHTFLFTGAVRKIKDLVDAEALGKLYYYDSTRVNLGLFQHDVNVIWDLAPHDFSIMNYVLPGRPVALSAHGIDHFGRNLENVAYVTVHLENNVIAHFNFNWLSPVKMRTTLIGGEHKMLVWNDLQADEKIKIYDKGVQIDSKEGLYNLMVQYRSGDIHSPRLETTEALRGEAEYLRDCLQSGTRPFNDGQAGLDVVRLLEATDESLKNNGRMVELVTCV